jgi:hypothetical protein
MVPKVVFATDVEVPENPTFEDLGSRPACELGSSGPMDLIDQFST